MKNFIILFLLGMSCVCISPNRAYSFEFEKGDGVFRDYDSLFDLYDLPFSVWPGHAGMCITGITGMVLVFDGNKL